MALLTGQDAHLHWQPRSLTEAWLRLFDWSYCFAGPKVLAALNHPNIAAIYGLESSESTHYLVLELVPG